MSDITVLPTKFDVNASTPEKFRQLALDAEKFPERYKHFFMLAVHENLTEYTRLHSAIPPLLGAGICDVLEDMLLGLTVQIDD